MILVPQKCVGVLQLFTVNVDLFSTPCSLNISAWHLFLPSALLPQQESAGQCPRPRAGLHHPSHELLVVCAAAGKHPVSSRQLPGIPPTSAGIAGSRSCASDGERPPAPELLGSSYVGTPRLQPVPLNAFCYYSHFTKHLIAAIPLRLSRSDSHRCSHAGPRSDSRAQPLSKIPAPRRTQALPSNVCCHFDLFP